MINPLDIDWSQYEGIEYYNPQKVAESLIKLQYLNNETEIDQVYFAVTFSVGNNHAGTYYPAVLSALPIVLEVALLSEYEIARNCALCIISDWLYFYIEMGTYNIVSENEFENFINRSIQSFIDSEKIFNESDRNKKVIEELIDILLEKKEDKF